MKFVGGFGLSIEKRIEALGISRNTELDSTKEFGNLSLFLRILELRTILKIEY